MIRFSNSPVSNIIHNCHYPHHHLTFIDFTIKFINFDQTLINCLGIPFQYFLYLPFLAFFSLIQALYTLPNCIDHLYLTIYLSFFC